MKSEFPLLLQRLLAGVLLSLALSASASEKATPLKTFGRLPIKEVTVFKDGHACVAHEGPLPTDARGNVLMDYLPAPVLGTFWPYVAEPGARLTSVVAGQKRVLVERTALSLPELLEANVGAEAIIQEPGTNRYTATVIGLPARSAEELEATSPPSTGESLPQKGSLVLLRTAAGVKAVPLDHIQEVTFVHAPKPAAAVEEFRNLLTLRLEWNQAKPKKAANVGLFYVQKGIRWIPNYKIELDGNGKATVKLQATLLNELADLDDVPVNLVIGVPTFAFKETLDPMALEQSLAQLSSYFQAGGGQSGALASQFSNAIMSQARRPSGFPGAFGPGQPAALGPEIGGTEKSEDLFVFNVGHVTLRKGERMALPIAEFTVPYQDVFTLELPFGPPAELHANLNNDQQRELERLFNQPRLIHKIRLTNQSQYPLTTAPALLLRGGRALAQGLMTYTASGATVDVPLTTALDFQVRKTDLETKRTPNAFEENGARYLRVDLTGKITLASFHAQPAAVEVTRYLLGAADRADHGGKLEKLNAFDGGEFLAAGELPLWWSWYGWPFWWSSVNGTARITWKLTLEPKQTVELGYDWHYFWR